MLKRITPEQFEDLYLIEAVDRTMEMYDRAVTAKWNKKFPLLWEMIEEEMKTAFILSVDMETKRELFEEANRFREMMIN